METVCGKGNIVAGGSIIINDKYNVASNGENSVVGCGKVTAERRQIARIDSIVLDGPVTLLFSQGGSQFVRVTADKNILPLVTTSVFGTTLHIECMGSFSTNHEIIVEVEMLSLKSLVTSGSGNVEIEKITQPSMDIILNGTSNIVITGKVDHFTAELNGSGDVMAKSLEAKTVVLLLNGSGDISAYASELIKARLNGTGDITISGQPIKQDCVASGSGNIQIR